MRLGHPRRHLHPDCGTAGQTAHGTFRARKSWQFGCAQGDARMNSIIYLVGLVVVVMAVLSFVGIR
jgi:hypothetical protein